MEEIVEETGIETEESVDLAAVNEKLLEKIAFLETENAALKAELENVTSQYEAAKNLPKFSAKTSSNEDKFSLIKEIFRK